MIPTSALVSRCAAKPGWVITIGAVLNVLDGAMPNVALPRIADELSISSLAAAAKSYAESGQCFRW